MAKSFAEVYGLAKETAYSDQSGALVLAASLNSVFDFTPVFKPNGQGQTLGTAVAGYNIQRAKRIKAHEVAEEAATGRVSAADALKALDEFSTMDWETIGVATGKLRGIGLKTGINEEFDATALTDLQAKIVADAVNVQKIERNERLLAELVSGSAAATVIADTDKIWDVAVSGVEAIGEVVDDFKYFSGENRMLILMTEKMKNKAAKEIGTVFLNEAPIYKTGLNSRFSINGVPVLVLPELKTTDKGGKRVEMIILDVEALAFKAADETKEVSVDLGLQKFNGVYFYSIEKLVDASRVKVYTSAAAPLDKVSKVVAP